MTHYLVRQKKCYTICSDIFIYSISLFLGNKIFFPLFLISHNIQCYLVIFLHHYRGFESWDECLVTYAKASDIWILFSSICLETRRNPPNSPQSWSLSPYCTIGLAELNQNFPLRIQKMIAKAIKNFTFKHNYIFCSHFCH